MCVETLLAHGQWKLHFCYASSTAEYIFSFTSGSYAGQLLHLQVRAIYTFLNYVLNMEVIRSGYIDG